MLLAPVPVPEMLHTYQPVSFSRRWLCLPAGCVSPPHVSNLLMRFGFDFPGLRGRRRRRRGGGELGANKNNDCVVSF